MKHTILITGISGYVGGMLAHILSSRDDIERIVGVDKDPLPELLHGNTKINFVQMNLGEDPWEETLRNIQPTIVIHTAWQIRDMIGEEAKQRTWNITGSKRVVDYAMATPSVKRLIHFSTASIYGAYANNTIEHRFVETEPMLENGYRYGLEKREVDEYIIDSYKEKGDRPEIVLVRPAAVTGPRGRFMFQRFGLIATLMKQLPPSPVFKILSLLVTVIPAPKGFVRQFVHEDDLANILEILALKDEVGSFEIFNLAPPGPVVTGKDMGRILKRHVFPVPPFLIRIAFFVMRTITLGKVATTKDGWRFYSYPIVLDGSKVTKMLGYTYKYDSQSALIHTKGRYESFVAPEDRS